MHRDPVREGRRGGATGASLAAFIEAREGGGGLGQQSPDLSWADVRTRSAEWPNGHLPVKRGD